MSTSGVGVQSRILIEGLIKTGRYQFLCLGAAQKHLNYDVIQPGPDLIIKPIDGFGDPNLLKVLLATEKPDALMLFTDPRFFYYVWQMEDEVHQICPIVYNTLWDAVPSPEFNKVLYESTDLLNCINYPTYEFISEWFPEKTNYIPHAVPSDLYFPLPAAAKREARVRFFGSQRADHFIALFVGRNARRKRVNDILESWKFFIERLETQKGHKNATLVLHTDPLDPEGSNLYAVVEKLKITDTVVFSKDRVEFNDMNLLYNVADVNLNASCAEGFGLPILEGKSAGVPAITIKTGGLTRQVEDHVTGKQYGVALDPDVRTIVGNQMIPYIYEDHVSNHKYADAIFKVFSLSPDERIALSADCREHVLRDYRIEDLIKDWDKSLQHTCATWRDSYKPWTHTEV